MKPDRQINWSAFIHNSPHVKDIGNFRINPLPACKKDFERIVGCGDGDTDFSNWFRNLVEIGVFEFVGMISKGHRGNIKSKGYVINANKLMNYLSTNKETRELYRVQFRMYNKDKII